MLLNKIREKFCAPGMLGTKNVRYTYANTEYRRLRSDDIEYRQSV